VFLLAYGAITPSFSTTFFMVFSEALGGAPAYWVVTLLVSIAALIPFFTLSVVKTWFFPDYHNKIQWLQHKVKADDPEAELGMVLRQFSVRSTGVGVSARRDAKLVRVNSRVFQADSSSQGDQLP
jgi:phospholipid-translocating ATPase